MAAILNGLDASKEDPFVRLARDPDTLDSILDHPMLLEAVLSMEQSVTVSSELYFYVLVRHALKEQGVDHIEVADYVAATLVEFAKGNPFQTGPDDNLQINGMPYHIEFVEAIQAANAYDRFYLHVHCGNQFLVLTGLFPGFIKRREERRGAPGVRYYEGVARGSYRTAGIHPLADEFALAEVYEILSDQFRETRRALNRLANEYLWLGS
ncbi:MAG: hypothetical protein P1V20_27240 [Verrucomicrobiales bacterium]|nr:hypothetical protein [Verrucomicrobiales bacterium]